MASLAVILRTLRIQAVIDSVEDSRKPQGGSFGGNKVLHKLEESMGFCTPVGSSRIEFCIQE